MSAPHHLDNLYCIYIPHSLSHTIRIPIINTPNPMLHTSLQAEIGRNQKNLAEGRKSSKRINFKQSQQTPLTHTHKRNTAIEVFDEN